MTFTITAQPEIQQSLDPFHAIKAEAREHGKLGAFPQDPHSLIYWTAYCEGLREYELAQIKVNMDSPF
jgi:hypothetical protein